MKEGDVQTFLSSCLGDCLIGLCLNMEFSSYSLLLEERENKEKNRAKQQYSFLWSLLLSLCLHMNVLA